MSTPRSTERVVAGHQPHYCPWLGYVDKIGSVDVFCQIDVIPFEEQLFQHRNRIRAENPAGEAWLVVPVVGKNGDQLIMDVEIDNRVPWREMHWESIDRSYARAPYFSAYAPFLADLFTREWGRLVDLCRELGATTYVSGAGGNCPHLDESALEGAGIIHRKQRFTHPVYPQLHGEFMPRMAVLDLLFNCGPDAAQRLRG